MTAADQLRRVLHLIPALADDQDHPVSEVASLLGVDRKTLLGDLRALVDRTDDPPGFVNGVSIYLEGDRLSLHGSHFLRPMRLTRAELVALELGLAMLRSERPAEEHRLIDAARTQLHAVLARLPDETPQADGHSGEIASPVPPDLLATVREAARRRRKVALAYQRADESRPTDRTVCPYALVYASGMWYLVAHCERSDGLRIFRLDRIRTAHPTPERFAVPEDFSVAAVTAEGRAFVDDGAGRVTVRYSPRVARWIAEREGHTLADDGSLTLEHPLADVDWAVRHVLQYGPDAEVLAPEAARNAVRDRLERILAEPV